MPYRGRAATNQGKPRATRHPAIKKRHLAGRVKRRNRFACRNRFTCRSLRCPTTTSRPSRHWCAELTFDRPGFSGFCPILPDCSSDCLTSPGLAGFFLASFATLPARPPDRRASLRRAHVITPRSRLDPTGQRCACEWRRGTFRPCSRGSHSYYCCACGSRMEFASSGTPIRLLASGMYRRVVARNGLADYCNPFTCCAL